MATINRLKESEIQNGLPIDSDDLNDEFNQLVNESNSKETRLTSVESTVSTINAGSWSKSGTATFSNTVTFNALATVNADLDLTGTNSRLLLGRTSAPGTLTNGLLWINNTTRSVQARIGGVTENLAEVSNMRRYMAGPPVEYTSASTVTVKANLECTDDTGAYPIRFASDQTVALTTSGAGGLDTGSEASNTWYYVWAIMKSSDATVSAILSTSSTAPTLPSGYDLKRRLPIAVRNDGSSNIIPFYISYGWPTRPLVIYQVSCTNFDGAATATGTTNLVAAGTSGTYATLSAGSFVPPISDQALIKGYQNAGSCTCLVKQQGASTNDYQFGTAATNTTAFSPAIVRTNTSQQIAYARTFGTGSVYIDVTGYVVTDFI